MLKLLKRMEEDKRINPPSWLLKNTSYLTIMGSHAYGTNREGSDFDVYGFCIPPLEMLFSHLAGEIDGFGRQKKKFEQYQQKDILGDNKVEYDINIYNIVKYFSLCMDGNPSMIDSLFTPQECVGHCTTLGHMVRENRKIFLHKGAYFRYKGFSYSQLNKMGSKEPEGKRKKLREQYGFDVKFGMNLVRLLNEIEQILIHGDLDLRQNNEQLKAIRRGEVSEQEIRAWAASKEKYLEKLYEESKLPYGPDEAKIKQLLINCLEHHYGSLSKVIHMPEKYEVAIRDIEKIIEGTK